MKDPFSEYEALLERLETHRRQLATRAERRLASIDTRRLRRWVRLAWLVVAVLALPFYVLVAGSVLLYRHLGFATWPALAGGVFVTAVLLLAYVWWAWRRFGGRGRLPRGVARTTVSVVTAYCLYSLVYLSSLNVKDTALREHYRSLHPLLRVATATFILMDDDLVITDMRREPEDYARMGLPLYSRSLHFVQPDGYAHAVDLRTIARSEWRNLLLQAYFIALGFETLRHVGTADHLHVSLPP